MSAGKQCGPPRTDSGSRMIFHLRMCMACICCGCWSHAEHAVPRRVVISMGVRAPIATFCRQPVDAVDARPSAGGGPAPPAGFACEESAIKRKAEDAAGMGFVNGRTEELIRRDGPSGRRRREQRK